MKQNPQHVRWERDPLPPRRVVDSAAHRQHWWSVVQNRTCCCYCCCMQEFLRSLSVHVFSFKKKTKGKWMVLFFTAWISPVCLIVWIRRRGIEEDAAPGQGFRVHTWGEQCTVQTRQGVRVQWSEPRCPWTLHRDLMSGWIQVKVLAHQHGQIVSINSRGAAQVYILMNRCWINSWTCSTPHHQS